MAVDFDTFLEWANDRFGSFNVKVRHTAHGTEICTHSPWSEEDIGKTDRKFKLWMNTEGGKHNVAEGTYRCWLTDQSGTLVDLMAKWDGISYEEAEEILCGVSSLRTLEQKVHEFFGNHEEATMAEMPTTEKSSGMVLPEYSFLIDDLSPGNFMGIRARQYLRNRKIPTKGLYVCTDGDYKNRIIIPYYNKDEELIWYNARTMSNKDYVLRYMKPPEGDQDQVIYMTKWPHAGTTIYIMEGELDAITLDLCGFIGCAVGGKYISDTQAQLIRDYKIVLAFDADEAGLEALVNVGNGLLEKGITDLMYVRPPKVYKDWNKLLVERNEQTIKAYIDRFTKRFTPSTGDILLFNQLS